MSDLLHDQAVKLIQFGEDAHQILVGHEASKSRVISLDRTRMLLRGLSLQQDELFQQALMCIERGVYRAAHVMAWAAYIDYLEQKLASDGLVKVMSVKTGWSKYSTIEEISENVPEYQLIEAARDIRLLSKAEAKTILGLLSKRNECAHPTGYNPGLNESLGYVTELLSRLAQIQNRTI